MKEESDMTAAGASEAEEIQVGEPVRSYDFEDNPGCYVEGVVRGIANGRYEIEVTRRVWLGEEEPVAPEESRVYPPVNGLRTTRGRITNGVVRIGGEGTAAIPGSTRPRTSAPSTKFGM